MTMTADELISEGSRLSRECYLLGSWKQGETVAIWDGEGHRPRTKGQLLDEAGVQSRHWISIDSTWLVRQGILRPPFGQGHYSIYERTLSERHRLATTKCREFVLTGDTVPLAGASIEGEPLFPKSAQSFPPFEAVCLYGGPSVEDWIASFGLRRIDYEHSKLYRSNVAQAYLAEWDRRTPWWPNGSDGTAAVVGGWHLRWPEDKFYVPPETEPVLWTLRDSEPWIEVRRSFHNLLVYERIS